MTIVDPFHSLKSESLVVVDTFYSVLLLNQFIKSRINGSNVKTIDPVHDAVEDVRRVCWSTWHVYDSPSGR